jgi:hypothetical protein
MFTSMRKLRLALNTNQSINWPFFLIVAAGPPSILNVTTTGTNEIFLSWQSPEKLYREIDEYQIEIADQDSYFIQIKENFQRIKMIRDSHILVSHLLSASQIHAV